MIGRASSTMHSAVHGMAAAALRPTTKSTSLACRWCRQECVWIIIIRHKYQSVIRGRVGVSHGHSHRCSSHVHSHHMVSGDQDTEARLLTWRPLGILNIFQGAALVPGTGTAAGKPRCMVLQTARHCVREPCMRLPYDPLLRPQ